MITVAEARVAAAKRLRSRMGEWAGRLVGQGDVLSGDVAVRDATGEVAEAAGAVAAAGVSAEARVTATAGTVTVGFSLGLKPPTEARALADRTAAQEWVRSWREADGVRGCEVEWEHRAWPRIGGQTVPVRMRVADPWALADFAGGKDGAAWRTLASRARAIHGRFFDGDDGDSDDADSDDGREGDCVGDGGDGGDRGLGDGLAVVVRKHRSTIVALEDTNFWQVLDAAGWLADHPLERMRPRQLPLRGVDSKWFATHRSLVSDLYAALTGGRSLDILDPEDRVRIRILGTGCVAQVGASGLSGLTDLAAPVEQVAALPLRPRVVIVSENLESMLALPAWEGVVAVHGSGYAVSVMGRIGWMRDVPVLYWGDLDSHGFAILHRLRTHLPEVRSILMDEETLVAHRDLWVREEKPHRGAFDELTGQEERALARIRSEGDVRLEQERIPWDVALAALREAVDRPPAAAGD